MKRDTMWGIFHIDGDGYTYSTQTLCGLFFTENDAQAALDKHIELVTEWEHDVYPKFIKTKSQCGFDYDPHSREWLNVIRKIEEEEELWMLNNNTSRYVLHYGSNRDDYEILEIELETIF